MFYKNEELSKVVNIVFVAVLLLASCKSDSGTSTSGLVDLDLMKYGMPIKVKAPAEAKVESSDMGIMKDVTIKGDKNFYLQVTSGVATTSKIPEIKAQQMNEIKSAMFFDAIVEEEENGFIYRKKITEDRMNHDFRYIRVQADQEYIFQTGLMGQYSLEDVKTMYAAVQ